MHKGSVALKKKEDIKPQSGSASGCQKNGLQMGFEPMLATIRDIHWF